MRNQRKPVMIIGEDISGFDKMHCPLDSSIFVLKRSDGTSFTDSFSFYGNPIVKVNGTTLDSSEYTISSTTSPVAKTIANKVNTLIEKPAKYIMKKVAIKEIGISINGLKAKLQFLKNKKPKRYYFVRMWSWMN